MFVRDALGNPIMYRGNACAWEKGRQLVSYTRTVEDNKQVVTTFTYDGQGRRVRKAVSGANVPSVTTEYTYDSNGK